jgi:outer membrane protein OmpA-like peptidoglycan-associated protein
MRWKDIRLRYWAACLVGLLVGVASGSYAQVRMGNSSEGDSGIFHVLSSQTVPKGRLWFGVVHDNLDRDPLDVDETHYRVGLGFGITDWLQAQAAWDVLTQYDIDPKGGAVGFFNTQLVSRNTWFSGLGDLWAGLKLRALDARQQPLGLGVLARVKVPTASASDGVGTGKVDLDVRGLLEFNAQDMVGLFGNVGFLLAGKPEAHRAGNQFVYGAGLAFPYKTRVQLVAEVSGGVVQSGGQVDDYTDLGVGLRWFITDGLNVTAAYRRNVQAGSDRSQHPDGGTVVLGYWPQPKVAAPPPPQPPPPPPPPPPAPPPVVVPPVPGLAEVYFDFDRYEIRPTEVEKLDKLVQYLRDHPDVNVVVEGHTCYIGTDEYNMALGLHRAEAIKDYLVSKGIDANRIEVISYGETQPKYDNSQEITRRFNRRGWFVIREKPKQ